MNNYKKLIRDELLENEKILGISEPLKTHFVVLLIGLLFFLVGAGIIVGAVFTGEISSIIMISFFGVAAIFASSIPLNNFFRSIINSRRKPLIVTDKRVFAYDKTYNGIFFNDIKAWDMRNISILLNGGGNEKCFIIYTAFEKIYKVKSVKNYDSLHKILYDIIPKKCLTPLLSEPMGEKNKKT